MARGGTVTPRPLADGTPAYVLMWRVGGRRCKKTIRGTKRDAEAALTALLAARDRGEQRKISTELFEPYAARWLEAKRPRLEASTYADYEAHLRLRLIPTFGKLRIRDVTRARIEAYITQQHAAFLKGGASPSSRPIPTTLPRFPRKKLGRLQKPAGVKSINNSLIPLRQILARAVRDGLIAGNPAVSTRDDPLKLPYEAPRMAHLNREQAAAYLAAAPAEYRSLAEVLIGTGLRIGEALALEWGDVDLDGLTLRVSRSRKLRGEIGTTKSDRARVVHIDPGLAATLEAHRQATDPRNALVFASSSGTMMDPSNVRRRWHEPTLKAAKLKRIRLHDLRHSAATLAVTAGESILFVQAQLGHADVRTTQRYAHPDAAAHRAAAARVAVWRSS
jgi:integrase